jgi:hypothetical protein
MGMLALMGAPRHRALHAPEHVGGIDALPKIVAPDAVAARKAERKATQDPAVL